MATHLSPPTPSILLSPFPTTRTRFTGFVNPRTHFRSSGFVTRLSFKPGFFPDPENSEALVKGFIDKAETFIYTIADSAVNSDSIDVATSNSTKQNGDWLAGITNAMESVLKVLKDGLSTLHVPYSYGFAIILLTILVKAATFPLTKKQVESAMAMRSLQPQVKAIQQKYKGNQEKIQIETARLYKVAGINPLAGCLPTLATIPVWIGLYRALSNVADEGLLTEGFFWIPSLAGPTTIAARQSGSGISWLFPFVDGHPPLGWPDTLAYLVLPVLLVISQYVSVQIMQTAQSNDPNVKTSQAITQFLPLMIGYFALSVPSGLSLYWLTNNILSTGQQVWLQKMGGAKNPARQFNDDAVKKDLESQNPVTQLSSTKVEVKQTEELTAEGLRPGERFKQLKEQEARRKRQREEEKRKAEESAKGYTENIEPDEEANFTERAISTNLNGDDTDNKKTGNGVVNGNLSSQESSEIEETTAFHSTEKSEVSNSSEVCREDEKLSNEEQQKEAVKVGGVNSTEDNLSEQR